VAETDLATVSHRACGKGSGDFGGVTLDGLSDGIASVGKLVVWQESIAVSAVETFEVRATVLEAAEVGLNNAVEQADAQNDDGLTAREEFGGVFALG